MKGLALCAALVCLLATSTAAGPYFLIDSEIEWNEAMARGQIQPMTAAEWGDYMAQWAMFLEEGTPYPTNLFSPPQLYVWPGGGGGGTDPEDAGLVMAWSGDPRAGSSFSSAWKWVYVAGDPDLTGCTINVTVTAPQFSPLTGNQVNNVSFGIRDINGAIRSWNWNCGPGGPIPWNVPVQITINPMILSVNAAMPAASGFANNPMFNIVQSMNFIVDENSKWVAQQGVPPPGQTIPGMWNYWHNLYVTPPIPPKNPDPLKWSQPVVEYQPGMRPPLFLGWDERSIYYQAPICADDWLCTDNRPVTDIHWWGSFIGWTQPDPPRLPVAFHLAIWKDVPGTPFSHPGQMVWEHYCENYTWNFAGYDKDPRGIYENEACFQFHQYLPDKDWFYQDPGPDGKNIYWLSIAAIYDETPQYPWGWKTRPHFFQDDAVRIYQVKDPAGAINWPPHINWSWAQGQPIMWQDQSWDLAFELTTRDIEQPMHDLGDAPDSTNTSGAAMTAYPGVPANFPTVFQAGSPPFGPLHKQPFAMAFLGNSVSLENEADVGVDQDGVNNIQPPTDTPDQDLADDGVAVPLALPNCQWTSFNYTVTCPAATTVPLYVNAWFDWNRDGDWDDTLQCPAGGLAPEWAVQNQIIPAGTPAGTQTFTTPRFLPWNPASGKPAIWMRITIAEQPWQPGSLIGWGGCGPAGGYEYGETEDYVFDPVVTENYDFGDAPEPPYPTKLPNGARHVIMPGFCLGTQIDAEGDGQPDATATGDDVNGIDDEDGVTFPSAILPGQATTCTVSVTGVPGTTYFLDAWIDFDGNGSWADPGEQIAASLPVFSGPLNLVAFAVPATTPAGVSRAARFRLSTTGGLGFSGLAKDGEVEDYMVPIGYKWVQKPDLSPLGIDVNATQRYILADDFLCTVTGPITDIHVWGSWYHDILPMEDPTQVKFRLSIHKDVPKGPDGEYSHPGEVLWFRDFGPGQFHVTREAAGIDEGWLNPPSEYLFPADHNCWRYDFTIDEAPFFQQGDPQKPVVYWLDVQAEPMSADSIFGWKTSREHWNDDAVWGQGIEPYPGPWYELRYPPNHEMHGQSIDLAFAITGRVGEPPQPGNLTFARHSIIPNHFWWPGSGINRNNMLCMDVSADAIENIKWETIQLTHGGTGNPADVATVEVWQDVDGNCKWSAADVLLGTGSYVAGVADIALTAPPVIPAGSTFPVVITYTMANAPVSPIGSAWRFQVTAASGTGQTSGLPVGILGLPVTSSVKILGLKPISIGRAKLLPIGTQFLLEGKVCTADFQTNMSLFYIEELDRSAGIGVNTLGMGATALNMWDRVSVLGTCSLINGTELVVTPQQIAVAPGAPPFIGTRFPVGMNNKWTGGGAFGGQPAVYDDAWFNVRSMGLNNVGMLITTWGQVTYHQPGFALPPMVPGVPLGDMFWINDGTNLLDGTSNMIGLRNVGVAVWLPLGYPGLPNPQEYWGVTGILRTFPSPMGFPMTEPVRMLVPRLPTDLVRYK